MNMRSILVAGGMLAVALAAFVPTKQAAARPCCDSRPASCSQSCIGPLSNQWLPISQQPDKDFSDNRTYTVIPGNGICYTVWRGGLFCSTLIGSGGRSSNSNCNHTY